MSELQLFELYQLVAEGLAEAHDIEMAYSDVVTGQQPLEISHAGGELDALYTRCVKTLLQLFNVCLIY